MRRISPFSSGAAIWLRTSLGLPLKSGWGSHPPGRILKDHYFMSREDIGVFV